MRRARGQRGRGRGNPESDGRLGLGSSQPVLVCGLEDGLFQGRNARQHPPVYRAGGGRECPPDHDRRAAARRPSADARREVARVHGERRDPPDRAVRGARRERRRGCRQATHVVQRLAAHPGRHDRGGHVLVHERGGTAHRSVPHASSWLPRGEEPPPDPLHPRGASLELWQRLLPGVSDARRAGVLGAVHQPTRLERLRPRVHVRYAGALGDGGLPRPDEGGGRGDRPGRCGHDAPGSRGRLLRRFHDQLGGGAHAPLRRGGDRSLHLRLVFLVRLLGCARPHRLRVLGAAVGRGLAVPRALTDDLRQEHSHAPAHRPLGGRPPHADHGRRAAVRDAAQARRAGGVRALPAILPRPVPHRPAVAARGPAGADPHLVCALARQRRDAARRRHAALDVMPRAPVALPAAGPLAAPLSLAAQQRRPTGQTPAPRPRPPAATRPILDNVILLLVPSLNPDGVSIVTRWYNRTLGTPAEGTDPPELYHHYTGHDNNRDWYPFTQVETQLVVDSLHNVWHPEIVHDIHQQDSDGSRLFLPPYLDPVEPNVDPLLVDGVNALGASVAWQLAGEGKTGIAINAIYDAWTPARAYQHYHGGVRILSEAASANLASPIEVPFDHLATRARGFNPRERSWNFTNPWPGGRWTLRDIVGYQTDAAYALLENAARYRDVWLANFLTVESREVRGWRGWPYAYVIPRQPRDTVGLTTLLGILRRGQVEIRTALHPITLGGQRYAAGSYVVVLRQPYAAFAKTLLEPQQYPDLRLYPGGPPLPPYDVTAHTLPLLMGVAAVPARDSLRT